MLKSSCLRQHYKLVLLLTLYLLNTAAVFAQTTAFTYQGRLTDGGNPANGSYDLQFKLFDLASGGTQQGMTQTLSGVTVTNGIFTVQLDFGSSVFTSNAGKFLEIGVRNAGGPSFTTLPQRQPVNATPYAIQSISATAADGLSAACSGCVTSSQIADSTIANADVSPTAAIAYSKLNLVNSIQNADIVPNAITTSKVANGTVTNAKLADAAVNSIKIEDGSIVNADISATAAIANTKIAGLGSLATVTPTGTANSTTFLRGDNTWAAVAGGGGQAILGTLGADFTISTSSPTYSDVVSITLEANKTYFIHGIVLGSRVGGTNGNGTVRVFYSGNATTLTSLAGSGAFSPGVSFSNSTAYDQETAGAPSSWGVSIANKFEFRGYFQTTTAGTLKLQAARTSTNTTVDLFVSDGSFILAIPVN